MKVYKALVVAGLCASMTLGLAACGGKTLDGSQTVATVGEKTVTLGEANFLLRYQQVQSESYYEAMFGEGFYDLDLFGNGSTYGESFKSDVLSQLQQFCIIEDKAADYGVALTEEETAGITAAAQKFMETNDQDTLEQMTADQATIERVLTLYTLSYKVGNAIKDAAEITVTEEDAAQRSFEYLSISKGSGDSALTEDQITEKKAELTDAIEGIKGGSTLGDMAAELELTASQGSYGKTNASSYDEALINALEGLSEGEVTEIIETDAYLYVAQLTSEYDEEASASVYSSLVSTEQTEYYNSLMETWETEYPLTVEESVWKDVKFNRSYEVKAEEVTE